jgi:hypothetical protein
VQRLYARYDVRRRHRARRRRLLHVLEQYFDGLAVIAAHGHIERCLALVTTRHHIDRVGPRRQERDTLRTILTQPRE